jgi:hypothetical protein
MASEEPIELKITNETIPSAQIGSMTSEAAPAQEVAGRAMETRLARCGSCGNVGYINYDTVNYRAYSCNRCGSVGAGKW